MLGLVVVPLLLVLVLVLLVAIVVSIGLVQLLNIIIVISTVISTCCTDNTESAPWLIRIVVVFITVIL